MDKDFSKAKEERKKELAWWITKPHYTVFNMLTGGSTMEEIITELKIGNARMTRIISHPYFLKKFQNFLFDGALNKAVIKIKLVAELWKNLRGKTAVPENKVLLSQFVRLLSEKDTKGIVSSEFMALIAKTKEKADSMSEDEREAKVKEKLDYQEAEFEEPSIKKTDAKLPSNSTVDNAKPAEDKQGTAD